MSEPMHITVHERLRRLIREGAEIKHIEMGLDVFDRAKSEKTSYGAYPLEFREKDNPTYLGVKLHLPSNHVERNTMQGVEIAYRQGGKNYFEKVELEATE